MVVTRTLMPLLVTLAVIIVSVVTTVALLVEVHHREHGVAAEDPVQFDTLPVPFARDQEGDELALSFAKGKIGTISAKLPFLRDFGTSHGALVLRHLETSAAWYVGRENGRIFACRRRVENGRWTSGTWGYSTTEPAKTGQVRPQYRILIEPEGRLRPEYNDPASTLLAEGSESLASIRTEDRGNQGLHSNLVIQSGGADVEIFEQSSDVKRRFTIAALAELNKEFNAVLASSAAKMFGFDIALIPSESVRTGTAKLELVEESKDHLYHVYGYLNPGESGDIYPKIVNCSGVSTVSIVADGYDPVARIGWSVDSDEKFFCSFSFRISNIADDLTVRLELWFKPDIGGRDRKLIEGVFRVKSSTD